MHIKKIFGLEIRVPPPGKIRNFGFLPKTYFSPGISKGEFPPRQNLGLNPDFSPKFWGEMTLCRYG